MRIVQHLSDVERQILHDWGDDVFGVAAYGLSWRAKNWHIWGTRKAISARKTPGKD